MFRRNELEERVGAMSDLGKEKNSSQEVIGVESVFRSRILVVGKALGIMWMMWCVSRGVCIGWILSGWRGGREHPMGLLHVTIIYLQKIGHQPFS